MKRVVFEDGLTKNVISDDRRRKKIFLRRDIRLTEHVNLRTRYENAVPWRRFNTLSAILQYLGYTISAFS